LQATPPSPLYSILGLTGAGSLANVSLAKTAGLTAPIRVAPIRVAPIRVAPIRVAPIKGAPDVPQNKEYARNSTLIYDFSKHEFCPFVIVQRELPGPISAVSTL